MKLEGSGTFWNLEKFSSQSDVLQENSLADLWSTAQQVANDIASIFTALLFPNVPFFFTFLKSPFSLGHSSLIPFCNAVVCPRAESSAELLFLIWLMSWTVVPPFCIRWPCCGSSVGVRDAQGSSHYPGSFLLLFWCLPHQLVSLLSVNALLLSPYNISGSMLKDDNTKVNEKWQCLFFAWLIEHVENSGKLLPSSFLFGNVLQVLF